MGISKHKTGRSTRLAEARMWEGGYAIYAEKTLFFLSGAFYKQANKIIDEVSQNNLTILLF